MKRPLSILAPCRRGASGSRRSRGRPNSASSEFDVTFSGPGGATATQAGSHPFEMTTNLHLISKPTGEGGEETEEEAKDIIVTQVPGFVGNPTAVPRCPTRAFWSKGSTGRTFRRGVRIAPTPRRSERSR